MMVVAGGEVWAAKTVRLLSATSSSGALATRRGARGRSRNDGPDDVDNVDEASMTATEFEENELRLRNPKT